jgi:hypothetical protein
MSVPYGSSVVDIDLSSLTNLVYAKVRTSDWSARICKYNIMGDYSYIMQTDIKTKIIELKYSDSLVYQDSTNNIYVRDGALGTTERLSFNGSAALLGIDSEDNIYAGKLNSDGKIECIYYGKLGTLPEQAWDKISLDIPVSGENINIASSGKVISVNEDMGNIYNVKENKQIPFKGTFIEVLDSYIATVSSGKLKLISY